MNEASLYNRTQGMDGQAVPVLALLGLTWQMVPRFRDAFVDGAGRVAVYTRTGGPNRPDFAGEMLPIMALNPVEDTDDAFIPTYRTLFFAVPGTAKFTPKTEKPDDGWLRVAQEIKSGGTLSPKLQAAVDAVGASLADQVVAKIEEKPDGN